MPGAQHFLNVWVKGQICPCVTAFSSIPTCWWSQQAWLHRALRQFCGTADARRSPLQLHSSKELYPTATPVLLFRRTQWCKTHISYILLLPGDDATISSTLLPKAVEVLDKVVLPAPQALCGSPVRLPVRAVLRKPVTSPKSWVNLKYKV